MYIRSLNDLQNWVDYHQKGKCVGLLTNKDVKLFWNVQKKLEEAVKNNTSVKAYLHMNPSSTWAQYYNTSYKGPCQNLYWWSSGKYRCEREDAEHKSWNDLDADDTKEDFYGILTAAKTSIEELLDVTAKLWDLGNMFEASLFRNTPNDNDKISVCFSRKHEQD